MASSISASMPRIVSRLTLARELARRLVTAACSDVDDLRELTELHLETTAEILPAPLMIGVVPSHLHQPREPRAYVHGAVGVCGRILLIATHQEVALVTLRLIERAIQFLRLRNDLEGVIDQGAAAPQLGYGAQQLKSLYRDEREHGRHDQNDRHPYRSGQSGRRPSVWWYRFRAHASSPAGAGR
jgi:hypothetical protein